MQLSNLLINLAYADEFPELNEDLNDENSYDLIDMFIERMAIMEFYGGLDRKDAKKKALKIAREKAKGVLPKYAKNKEDNV